jgi:small subunit ribosomal protein S6
MRTYEVLFIVSPRLSDDEATNLITEFRTIAEKNGGRIASEDAWGRRRLATPINKTTEGIYHLFVIEADTEPHELDRRMKNSDQIIRHMIVRTDLDQKRAAKLAKKNPPKERVSASASAPVSAAAAAEASAAAPTEAAVPTEAPAAVETSAPAETPAQAESPAQAETPAEAAAE